MKMIRMLGQAEFDERTAKIERLMQEIHSTAKGLPGYGLMLAFMCPKPDGSDARVMYRVDAYDDMEYAPKSMVTLHVTLTGLFHRLHKERKWIERIEQGEMF